MSEIIKPPLGIMPRTMWTERRIEELARAITRAVEWLDEHSEAQAHHRVQWNHVMSMIHAYAAEIADLAEPRP